MRLCVCTDCKVLDKFLLDPGSKNKEFPMKKSRRDHLEIQLRSQRSSLCIETKARGSPYILVLSKTNGEYELHAWQKRTKAVKTIMDKLGNVDDLGDRYAEIYAGRLRLPQLKA